MQASYEWSFGDSDIQQLMGSCNADTGAGANPTSASEKPLPTRNYTRTPPRSMTLSKMSTPERSLSFEHMPRLPRVSEAWPISADISDCSQLPKAPAPSPVQVQTAGMDFAVPMTPASVARPEPAALETPTLSVSPVALRQAFLRRLDSTCDSKKRSRTFRSVAEGIRGTIRMQFMADDGFRDVDVDGLVRRIAVTLSSLESFGILAARIFDRFCITVRHPGQGSERRIPTARFGDVLAHWQIPEVHVPLFWALLRKQKTYWDIAAIPNTISYDDFHEVLAKVLRRVRDRFCGHKISKDQFVTQNTRSLEEVYVVGEPCGTGSFGDCNFVTHRASERKLVCKKITSHARVPREEIAHELDMLKRLDHPHIVRVFEWFESEEAYLFILEYARGGDLRRLLLEKTAQCPSVGCAAGIGEELTGNLMGQTLRAVAYIHSQCIIHRDLKPANMLLASPDLEKPHLLLADFGLADLFEERATSGSMVVKGTAPYMPLEVFNGNATMRSDIWAVGVIMFELLCGKRPFRADNMPAMFVRLKRGQIDYEPVSEAGASEAAISFIKRLLVREEADRPGAAEVLRDPWLASHAPAWELSRRQARKIKRSLKAYLSASAFAKVAMNCIASQLGANELDNMRHAFETLDANYDGELSMDELSTGLQKLGVDQKDAARLAAALDMNHDGAIQYSEFAAALLETQFELAESNLRMAFDIFDVDRNGTISLEELQLMLANGGPLATVLPDGQNPADVLAEVDTSKDGVISFAEFRAYLFQEVRGISASPRQAEKHALLDESEPLSLLLRHLARDVGHPEADCVAHAKRLAVDHWLCTAGDLRSVATADWWRLGLPLKLEAALKYHCGLS